METIKLIAGGLDYEKQDVENSIRDIYNSLGNLDFNLEIIRLHDHETNLKSIDYKGNINFIIDPYYIQNDQLSDVRNFFETNNIYFIGSSTKTASICKDKVISKIYFSKLNLNTPKHIVINNNRDINKLNLNDFSLPVILKPQFEGAGTGVSLCYTKDEVFKTIEILKSKFSGILVEEYISGKEITVGVIGTGDNAIALPPVELELPFGYIYNHQVKNNPDMVKRHVPARISNSISKKILEISLQIHKTIGCRSFSRIDYRIRNEEIYPIEINASPALAKEEHIARSVHELNWTYKELLMQIIDDFKQYCIHENK